MDTDRPRLLIVAHAPSPNTVRLREALLRGARHPDAATIEVQCAAPLETGPDAVRAAAAVLLSTPENLGYMSGAMKDFFDRIYYPCLEHTQGLPFALQVRAGQDGAGTCRAIDTITTGLRWRAVQPHLVCRGPFEEAFVGQCEELAATMAVGLAAGIL